MKENLKILYGSRSLTQDFLVDKTDIRKKGKHRCRDIFADFGELLEGIPNLVTDRKFFRQAMEKFGSVRQYGVLAMRIDQFLDTEIPASTKYISSLLSDILRIVDHFAKTSPGVWGLYQDGMIGLWLPDADELRCLSISESLQAKLRKKRRETLSIGVATCPMAAFTREKIIENARKALDHAGFFEPGCRVVFDSVSMNISADKLFQQGNIHGAIEEFKAAIMLESNNLNLRNSLGVCYGVLGLFDKALEEFETVIRKNNKEIMSLYNAALVNLLMGNPGKAISGFQRAIQIDSQVFEVAFQLARIHCEHRQYEKARPYLDQAYRLRPDSGTLLRYFGDYHLQKDALNEAVSCYIKAVKLNPNDAHALSGLGYLYEILGENPEIARVFCSHSVEIEPNNGLFRYRLGRLLFKLNHYDDALKEFDAASKLGYNCMNYIRKIQSMITAQAS